MKQGLSKLTFLVGGLIIGAFIGFFIGKAWTEGFYLSPALTNISTSDFVKVTKITNPIIVKDNHFEVWTEYDLDYAGVANTGSMLPLLNVNTTVIVATDEKAKSIINIGDVIIFEKPNKDLVIHRVIEKNQDELGVYYLTKGDNNRYTDQEMVRPVMTRGVVIAVIY